MKMGKRTLSIKYKYIFYRCSCGRKLVPVTNPSKCPYCGRVTQLR